MGTAYVRMNYATMERMENAFVAAREQLGATKKTMEKISRMLWDGALRGSRGKLLSVTIDTLGQQIGELEAKMGDLAADIKGAVEATRDSVCTARGRFVP